MEQVTSELFKDWREHPVTKLIFDGLQKQYQEITEGVMAGQTLGPDCTITALRLGRAQAIKDLLDIDFEETKTYDH